MLVNLLVAGASALLLVLAFPHFDLAWLAPFALAPLLIAVARARTRREQVLAGWFAGIAYWAGTCYWIHYVLAVHGGMAEWAAWLGFAVFSVYKALPMAVFALGAGLLIRRPWAVAAVPALWVAIERTHGALGFAWLALGNAGVDMSVLARLAPYTGVYGISFAFAMMATAVALVALRRPRIELAPLGALLLLALLPQLPRAQRPTEAAVLVQPDIPETAAWTPQWVEEMRNRMLALSIRSLGDTPAFDRKPNIPGSQPGVSQDSSTARRAPRLMVWPEAPLPLYYYQDAAFRTEVDDLARRTGAYLLVNVTPYASGSPLNSALLISPEGQPLGRYDKMNLVPFGEYVPRLFRSLIEKVSSEAGGDFAPGERQVILPAGSHRIGAFICYESVFPDFVRRFAQRGADLFVNISNDGWYGRTAARDQHLKIVRMRAAENRRWILRATNDGITATIDPAGRVYRNLPSYEAAAARTGYSYVEDVTFYSRHGDWFVWVCAILAAVALGEALRGHRWRTGATEPGRGRARCRSAHRR